VPQLPPQTKQLTPEEKVAKAAELKQEGNEAYKKRLWGRSIDLYSQAIDLDPTNAPYYGNRCAARINLGRYKLALDDATKAVELKPTFVKAYVRQSKCMSQLGDLKGAQDALAMCKVRVRNDATAKEDVEIDTEFDRVKEVQARYEQALRAGENGQWSTAARLAEELMGEDVTDSLPLSILRIRADMHQKQWQRMLQLAQTVYRANAGNNEVSTLRGIALYYTGNLPVALKHWQQVLGSDPEHKEASKYFRMVRKLERAKAAANEAHKKGLSADAIAGYTAALAIDPENHEWNATLYNNRAAAYMAQKNYASASADCASALKLNDDFEKAWVRKAKCDMELEKYEEVVRDYENAKRVNPENAREYAQKIRQAQLEVRKAKRKNYYKILNIAKTATEKEIKKAYRVGALRWHPDKNQESPEQTAAATAKFKDISEAYEILSDSTKRRRYDSGADIEDEMGSGGHGHGGRDMSDIFSAFFGGGGMGGGMGGGRGHSHGFH
jgi:DnaJ family protein C protein 7